MVDMNVATASPTQLKKSSSKRHLHCSNCGVRTHRGSKLIKVELKNENVYNGTCIRCNLGKVPSEVRESWKKQNSSRIIKPEVEKVTTEEIVEEVVQVATEIVENTLQQEDVVEDSPVMEVVEDAPVMKDLKELKEETESHTVASSDDSQETPTGSPDSSLLDDEINEVEQSVTLEFEESSAGEAHALLQAENETFEVPLAEEMPLETSPFAEAAAADIEGQTHVEDIAEEVHSNVPRESVAAETQVLPTKRSGYQKRSVMIAGAAFAMTGVAVALHYSDNEKIRNKMKAFDGRKLGVQTLGLAQDYASLFLASVKMLTEKGM